MREAVKRALATLPGGQPHGATLLIYHRVGGGSRDELDISLGSFRQQLDLLADRPVMGIDDVVDGLDAGDEAHRVVLTFDDGFRDVYDHAWPLLRERRLPFTVYLTTKYVGGPMRWEGSTAKGQDAPALEWDHLREMVDSGLCTVGNHTHSHVRPEVLTVAELDRCSELIVDELGVHPRHFAYTWGVPVPALEPVLMERFRTCATGEVGRNTSGTDRARLRRLPVRRTDPIEFFRAKLERGLQAERSYAGLVSFAKKVGVRA